MHATKEPETYADLTTQQKKSGLAAWLGWMFDGLDMHLYTLVALPFVAELMRTVQTNREVSTKASLIQASFLVGWAVGGRVLRPHRRSSRPQSRAGPDHPYLRLFHRTFVFCANLVAASRLSFSRRTRDRWRMGRRRVAARGNLAEALAAMARGYSPDRGKLRRPARLSFRLAPRRHAAPHDLPGRHSTSADHALDSQGGTGAGSVGTRAR
jgi:hypothetical protein